MISSKFQAPNLDKRLSGFGAWNLKFLQKKGLTLYWLAPLLD